MQSVWFNDILGCWNRIRLYGEDNLGFGGAEERNVAFLWTWNESIPRGVCAAENTSDQINYQTLFFRPGPGAEIQSHVA